MKRVGIITFHASHNYGSVLQAYALQQMIEGLSKDCKCEIINFRTLRQRDQYTPLTKRVGLKYVLKNSYFLFTYRARKMKYDRFETFIDKYLKKSPLEYKSLEELAANPPEYDYYISGGDQIWNTVPRDADMAYFMPFVRRGIKVAYAPSFGQIGEIDHREEVSEYINDYDYLSVRETFGQKLVEELTGRRDIPVLVDPVLLLQCEKWDELIEKRLVEEDYIFFYTLFATKEMIETVKTISQLLHMPVVISNITNQHDMLCGFRQINDAGPLEFLSLIKHAKAVVTSSFHGTVFSIIYEKSFLVYDGMKDKRICTLLEKTKLESRSYTSDDVKQKVKTIFDIDYQKTNDQLSCEQEIATEYLKKVLDLKL